MRVNSLHFLLIAFLFVSSSQLEANTNWRLDKDEEGIQIHLRNTAGSALKSFKGTMTVKGSLSSLLSLIDDTQSYPRWLHNCKSAKTISRSSDTKQVNYVVTNMPWPVADRDVVVASTLTQNKDNKRVEIKLRAMPQIVSRVAGKVRIEKMQGRWLLTPVANGKVNVIYEMSIDPGGNIPKWVVNTLAVDLPFYTLKNLRKISKEEKYANAKMKGIIE